MNTKKLLEQFLGPDTLANLGGQQQGNRAPASSGGHGTPQDQGGGSIGDLVRGALGGGGKPAQGGGNFGIPGGAVGGLAAGGLLGMLLGNKKMRKMAGGAAGYGGAAVLGALAHRAYQNWQGGQQADQAPVATAADVPQEGSRFAPATGADGKPFALALIGSMIAAANADGHIDADEQKQIFEAAERGDLDAERKAFIFDAMQNPLSPDQISARAKDQEQAAELYLAARVAIDPDHPDERTFLKTLAQALKLPDGLVSHLNTQVTQNLES
jgi:uncharacterized membrane protein YebE (DUF533 family)